MINKQIYKVPKGIRYFSELENIGFSLPEFPNILDKKIPGCGFTTWVLTNSQNIILASPRRMLLENKKEQHPDVFLTEVLDDEEIDYDKNLNSTVANSGATAPQSVSTNSTYYNPDQLKKDLKSYVGSCMMKKKPAKILVTFDSYRKVRLALEDIGVFETFYTIVDEFQAMLCDASFKSTTEMQFYEELKTIRRLCFASATPILESYLEILDYFKDLPYLELDWASEDPGRVVVPKIDPRTIRSVNTAVKPIIEQYRAGKFEHRLHPDPITGKNIDVKSKELVIYLNSVANIIGIIKSCDLKPSEVNILCANNSFNLGRINRKLNRGREKNDLFSIGKIPVKGKPRKMFTFCTRTVFLGADFYSDNARTIIVSDANIKTMAVDVTLDIPQIMGRQRMEENPWRGEAIVFYKKKMRFGGTTREEYLDRLNTKIATTNNLLSAFNEAKDCRKGDIAEVYEKVARLENYRDNYVAVNIDKSGNKVPVMNTLVILAEQRAFEIQQMDYSDRCVIFSSFSGVGTVCPTQSDKVQKFLGDFYALKSTAKKLEYLCNNASSLSKKELNQVFREIPNDNYRNFYVGLGPDRCRELGYNSTLLQRDYEIKLFDVEKIRTEIYSSFNVGEKISYSDIKSVLSGIYERLGYKKTPKATDLSEWFEIKDGIKIKNSDGKWVHGLEILGIKV